MRVLIAFASRHGGTEGIADAIGTVLRGWRAGDGDSEPWEVDVLAAADLEDVDVARYDAVVLGSAVYVGHWLDSARRFARRHEATLRHRPLWLFSSGPVGDPVVPADEATEMAELSDRLDAQGSRTFAGRLRTADLALVERASVRVVHANEGDYRDWPSIDAWARDIADSLSAAEAIVGQS